MNELSSLIKRTALDMGYENCGIIKINAMQEYEQKLDERISIFPDVKPHVEKFYQYAHPVDTYPWAKSIVICVRRYGKYKIPNNLSGLIGKFYLFDSRIDEGSEDYKDSIRFENYMKELGLKVLAERKFGITALRWAALQAGLGLVRKNNFFYTESGSWVYLEAWLIDEELECVDTSGIKACPEKCDLCIKACPTSSLSKPYAMNRSTCISCLNTWEGWDLPGEEHNSEMGNWIYGCDVCQDVCPMNRNKWAQTEDFPRLNELSKHLALEKILASDYKFLEDVVQPKFWYINKHNVWRWKTNSINAMINNYQDKYRKYILDACNDSNAKVREMAEWAIEKLNLN